MYPKQNLAVKDKENLPPTHFDPHPGVAAFNHHFSQSYSRSPSHSPFDDSVPFNLWDHVST